MGKTHQFAEGPWRIAREDVDLPGHVGITSAAHTMLAQVVFKMEDDARSPKCEAAVRLIRAAPEMYDLLHRGLVGACGEEWLTAVRDLLEDDIDAEGEDA